MGVIGFSVYPEWRFPRSDDLAHTVISISIDLSLYNELKNLLILVCSTKVLVDSGYVYVVSVQLKANKKIFKERLSC